MQHPIYQLKNISYNKKSSTILNIKNFEIHRGACYMFSGNMSCGKTLIVDLLTKRISKYNGNVIYDNENLKNISSKKYYNDISIVKQKEKVPFFKNVSNYIKNEIRKKHNDSTVDKKFNKVVTTMDIKYLLNENLRSLSPSQFRWVDLAAKISSYPKVLIIDEIELHLSKKNIDSLSKILYRKCNYDGVTLIVTSQNSELFKNLISINITLNHGRITKVRSYTNKNKKR